MKKLHVLLMLMALSVSTFCGCAWLRNAMKDACDASLPAIQKAQTYEPDAALALDQAAAFIAALPLTDTQRAEANTAISVARSSLQAAGQALAAIVATCTTPDELTLFDKFIKDWAAVEVFIAPKGVGVARQVSTTHPPLIVLEARLKAAHKP